MALPSGYKQLEYIESSGTQYINTGVVPKTNVFTIEMEAQYVGSSLSSLLSYCGFMNSSSATTPRCGIHNYQSKFMYGINATQLTVAADKLKHTFKLVGNASTQTFAIDGTEYSSTNTADGFSSNTRSIFLFSRNVGGSPSNLNTMRLYSCKISVGGALVRSFVPAKRNSDGVLGLYDTVNSAFYVNAGSGVFLAGPEVTGGLHTTLIDGVSREVVGGNAFVNGTAYRIKKGCTLVDGTLCEIAFVDRSPQVVTISSVHWQGSVVIQGETLSTTGIWEYEATDEGLTISVNVSGESSGARRKCYINLNGVRVQSGAGTYTFTTQAKYITISLFYVTYEHPTNGHEFGCAAEITTSE